MFDTEVEETPQEASEEPTEPQKGPVTLTRAELVLGMIWALGDARVAYQRGYRPWSRDEQKAMQRVEAWVNAELNAVYGDSWNEIRDLLREKLKEIARNNDIWGIPG
jgi:hypothetical protein